MIDFKTINAVTANEDVREMLERIIDEYNKLDTKYHDLLFRARSFSNEISRDFSNE